MVLGLSFVLLGASSGSAAGRPKLRLVRPAPLYVKATGFRSGERVRVRVLAPTSAFKRVTANSAGAFGVTFPTVSVGICSALTINAAGARGSRASLKHVPVLKRGDSCPPRP